MSLPSAPSTNHTPPLPWPLVSPGAASPEKRYSGHLPAFSIDPPAGASTAVTAAVMAGSLVGAPVIVAAGHALAHAAVQVGVPLASFVKPYTVRPSASTITLPSGVSASFSAAGAGAGAAAGVAAGVAGATVVACSLAPVWMSLASGA